MDRLKAMQTFVRIVEANSFSKAAETLNLQRASLTATLQNLEAFLGTRLLQRSTRRLSLTPDGAEYFEKCTEILAAIEEVESSFRDHSQTGPKGKLRLDMPGAVGRHVVLPRIAEFYDAYPELELVLSLTDRLVDMTQEGVDCALRAGSLQDSSLVGRQIGSMQFVTCASPSYLKRYGTPRTIDELQHHRMVTHCSGRTGRAFDWDFQVEGEVVKVEMTSFVSVNDADAHVTCGLQGLGLMQPARYQVREYLDSGDLVEVFSQWLPVPMPVSLLYPQNRRNVAKLRLFADWVEGIFRQHVDFNEPR